MACHNYVNSKWYPETVLIGGDISRNKHYFYACLIFAGSSPRLTTKLDFKNNSG